MNITITKSAFANQVTRVLNNMVANGEVVTKVKNGTVMYALAPITKNKEHKSMKKTAAQKAWETRRAELKNKPSNKVKASRSNAAHKAWETRRSMKAVAAKAADELFAKRSAIAHKAVATRRANALFAKRSASAHKAVATRVKNKARKSK